jgi:uncharacterized protein (DUF2132 family)
MTYYGWRQLAWNLNITCFDASRGKKPVIGLRIPQSSYSRVEYCRILLFIIR